jgi:hypothetical protein
MHGWEDSMVKITWLGDAECTWNDVVFPPCVPVEIDDPYMIGKARNSPFFKVETEVSFFDDPPEARSVFGIAPETWTNDEQSKPPYPHKRKRGRPPKVRAYGDQ